ncbi:MAG: FAD-binding oxidoreductase [Cytophagaceae bacterium]|jgi:ring-1,2-phenylacetyl-CoA epoxidase subunit PaaE|nr:FAD-binding oxidoreductase [Cytophagaceae bacterium]
MLEITVKEKVKETADAVTLVLDSPKPLVYKAGQFLTIEVEINEKKERRSYSFSSCPSIDPYPSITIKKINNGKVSTFLTENVQAGDTIQTHPIAGVFTLEKSKKNNALFIGGGSGITPLMSMIKEALRSKKYTSVFLFYSNRNETTEIFLEALNKLKESNTSFTIERFYSQSATNPKRLNTSTFLQTVENLGLNLLDSFDFFLCGPDGLIEEVESALALLKIPKDSIFKEVFTSSNTNDAVFVGAADTSTDTSKVTVLYQGNEYIISMIPNKSILESALEQNIDLPYSCMSGMCTACMGKCVNGKVEMSEQDGLSKTEVNNGFVLTCVGRPSVANTIIEID